MKLVLASGSPYRKNRLAALGLPFECHSPDINESMQPGETASELAGRLALEKAKAVAPIYPEHLIIGSDQTVTVNQTILGKPGNAENAIKQLTRCSGQTVYFFTGLTLLNSKTGNTQSATLPFHVTFRKLTDIQIKNYVEKERPFDCAGSVKCEQLGISLFTKMEGDDPNILIGLPLITLSSMLLNEDIDILAYQ